MIRDSKIGRSHLFRARTNKTRIAVFWEKLEDDQYESLKLIIDSQQLHFLVLVE